VGQAPSAGRQHFPARFIFSRPLSISAASAMASPWQFFIVLMRFCGGRGYSARPGRQSMETIKQNINTYIIPLIVVKINIYYEISQKQFYNFTI
jgi:hypothetical protein